MYTPINSTSLWIGTDLKKFNQIRDALDHANISYKHSTKNQLGEWAVQGTVRGNTGSLGNSSGQMYQYEIIVYNKDLERARYALTEK